MRLRNGLVTVVCALALWSCTRTNVALIDNSIHLARTCPDAVKLYTAPSNVGLPYTEVGLLNSSGSSGWTSESGMMKSMRQKAAEVGATGIIMGNIDEPGAGAKVMGAVFGTGTQRKGKSLAIFVPADSTRVKTVCAGK